MTLQRRPDGSLRHLLTLEDLTRPELEALLERAQFYVRASGQPAPRSDALAGVTRVSPKYAVEHQVAVIDCLEDPDDTLKLKTLELLATMTKANNVTVIVERLMAYLKGCTDEHVRRDIATKVGAGGAL